MAKKTYDFRGPKLWVILLLPWTIGWITMITLIVKGLMH